MNSYDSIQYLSEKFEAGASALASGTGSIKARLLNAYASQTMRGDRPGPDLPDGLADRITALHARMQSATESGPDGAIAHTVEAMTEQEAVDFAAEIFSIHSELIRADRAH